MQSIVLCSHGAHDFRIALLPVLKVIFSDKTIINIMTRVRMRNRIAIIYSQVEYRLLSDSGFMSRILGQSTDILLFVHREQRMNLSVERLHDKTDLKLSFLMPEKN